MFTILAMFRILARFRSLALFCSLATLIVLVFIGEPDLLAFSRRFFRGLVLCVGGFVIVAYN